MTSIKQIDPHIWSLPKDIIKKLARLSKTNLFLLKRLITVVKPDPEKVRWVDFSRTCEGVKVQVFKIFFSTGEASSDITVHPRQFYNHLKRAGIVEWDRKAGGAYLKISPEEILVAIPGESIEGLFSIEEQLIICYLAEVMEKR